MPKKIILILLLISSPLHWAQKSDYHITVKRGDYKELTFKHNGNITGSDITFVVKLTKSFSSPRLIQKENDNVSEITTSYSAPYTNITVKLLQSDTQDLTSTKYYYDIVADSTTIFDGEFRVQFDVQTPFDGTDLPEDGSRITTVSLDNGTIQDENIFWDTTSNKWKPAGKILSDSQVMAINQSVADAVSDSLANIKITNTPYLFSVVKEYPENTKVTLFKANESFKVDSVVGIVDAGSLKFNIQFGSIASPDSIFSTSQTLNNINGQSFTEFTKDTINVNDWIIFTTNTEAGVMKVTVVIYYTPLIGVTPIHATDGGFEDSYVMDNQLIDFFNGGRNVLNYRDSSAAIVNSGSFLFRTGFTIDSTFIDPIFHDAFRIKYNSGSAFDKYIDPYTRNDIFYFVGDYYASDDEEANAVLGFWINRTDLNGNGISFCNIGGEYHYLTNSDLETEGYEYDRYGIKFLKVLKVDGDYSYVEYYAYKYKFDNKLLFRLEIYNGSENDVTSLTIYNPTLIYTKSIDPYHRYLSYAEKTNSRFIGKKILYVGDSQYNDGRMHCELAKLSGAEIIDAHEGGHRMTYSSTSWFYDYTKFGVALEWSDIDYYFLPISSNDNAGGNTRQTAVDSVKYFYPYYGDSQDTIIAKLSRFNALSESDKASVFGYKQTYIAYIKQLLQLNPKARIIIGTIPMSVGSGTLTGSVDENGYGIWQSGYGPDERRAALTSSLKAKRDDIIEVKDYFNANFVDLFNEVGLTFDNFNIYSLDGVHWDLKSGEIKKRIAYAFYQELLKVK